MLSYPVPPEIAELRDAVRRFALAEIAPLARRIDRDDWFARELWPKMGALGILGPTVPEEYGGAGLCYRHHAVITEEKQRTTNTESKTYIAHSNLCVNQIRLHGT